MKTPIFKRPPTREELLSVLCGVVALNEEPYSIWPEEKKTFRAFTRPHDECDGDDSQTITVTMAINGDMDFSPHEPHGSYLFRNMYEGTASPRTGNALRLLWYALFNEENLPRIDRQQYEIAIPTTRVLRVLETYWMPPEWINGAKAAWMISHDDSGGNYREGLSTALSKHTIRSGDVVVSFHSDKDLHYRSKEGGGSYLMVHNALRVLALAIKLDNEVRIPDHPYWKEEEDGFE